MPKRSRWAALPQFPLTKAILKCYPHMLRRKHVHRSEIVSDRLCDDIIQRVSPYLVRKPPVDIIDLWPGAGLLSSKVNDFLKPRRHVLVEPDLTVFESLLKPMAESKSCYKLLSMNIFALKEWRSFISDNLPEQGPSNCDSSGSLPKNNSLLVLAQVPPNASTRDHFTPARWWTIVMENALRQADMHSYGVVRFLVSLPTTEAQAVIPRSVSERKRPALMTENIALHAFEVAATDDPGMWTTWKGLDLIRENAARVSERAAAQNIVMPEGRELPPPPLAPQSPKPGLKPCPYVPRLKYDKHDKIMEAVKAAEGENVDKALKNRRDRAVSTLNHDNRSAYTRQQLGKNQMEIDEMVRSLSRGAADPKLDYDALKPLVDKIAASKAALSKEIAALHYETIKPVWAHIDDLRGATRTGCFDDSLLLWDRRPYEPLYIQPEEIFPRESDRAMIYFEANANSTEMQRIAEVDASETGSLFSLFEAVSMIFSSRGAMSVGEVLTLMFPNRHINDIVRSIPSLATFASKTPKLDFDSLPKTLHTRPGNQTTDNLDPVVCFQENLDYDLSDVRVRTLSTTTLWDLSLEYHVQPDKVSSLQLNRLLGGTLTSFRAGEYLLRGKKNFH